jgi:hypothetical protein
VKVCACQRVKLGRLCLSLYKLGGSITAGIRARLSIILSCTSFENKGLVFEKPILSKKFSYRQVFQTNLQNYASNNLQLSPIKDYYVALSKLILTMGEFTLLQFLFCHPYGVLLYGCHSLE